MLLAVLVSWLQACDTDPELNWTPDSLAITVSGQFENGNGKAFDAGDGNWGVNISPEFGGDLKIEVNADKNWIVDIEYYTLEETDWIIPSTVESAGSDLTLSIGYSGW